MWESHESDCSGKTCPSMKRLLIFVKKKFKIDGVWHTWIDFPKWHELVNSGQEFTSMDFLKRTPQTGISGRGTIDRMNPRMQKVEQKETESAVFVDEKTKEMEFYESEQKNDEVIHIQ